jgi:hypothetical protein
LGGCASQFDRRALHNSRPCCRRCCRRWYAESRTRGVAAWPIEARDETACHWITTRGEDDWYRIGRVLGSEKRLIAAARNNHSDLLVNQFICHRWQQLVVPIRPTILDDDITTFHIPGVTQTLSESRSEILELRC